MKQKFVVALTICIGLSAIFVNYFIILIHGLRCMGAISLIAEIDGRGGVLVVAAEWGLTAEQFARSLILGDTYMYMIVGNALCTMTAFALAFYLGLVYSKVRDGSARRLSKDVSS